MKARSKRFKQSVKKNAAPVAVQTSAVAVLEPPPPAEAAPGDAGAAAVPVVQAAQESAPAVEATTLPDGATAAPAEQVAPDANAGPTTGVQPSGQTEPEGEEPEPPEPPEPHHQSLEQLELLRIYEEMRAGLLNAGDAFRLLMPTYGLTPEFFVAGDSLHEVASDSIDARRAALAATLEATAAQKAAYHLARTSYSAFRRVARPLVQAPAGRVALGLDEKPPHGMAAFAQSAEDALTAAQTEPYATLLGTATFGPDRVAETMAAIRVLKTAIINRKLAADAATQATEARNAAFANLRIYISHLRVEVDTILRLHPHLHRPIGF